MPMEARPLRDPAGSAVSGGRPGPSAAACGRRPAARRRLPSACLRFAALVACLPSTGAASAWLLDGALMPGEWGASGQREEQLGSVPPDPEPLAPFEERRTPSLAPSQPSAVFAARAEERSHSSPSQRPSSADAAAQAAADSLSAATVHRSRRHFVREDGVESLQSADSPQPATSAQPRFDVIIPAAGNASDALPIYVGHLEANVMRWAQMMTWLPEFTRSVNGVLHRVNCTREQNALLGVIDCHVLIARAALSHYGGREGVYLDLEDNCCEPPRYLTPSASQPLSP